MGYSRRNGISYTETVKPLSATSSFLNIQEQKYWEVVLGCTPGGYIWLISDAFVGSASDRQLIKRNILEQLHSKGDSIMADKCFNVQDIFAPLDVLLNISIFA